MSSKLAPGVFGGSSSVSLQCVLRSTADNTEVTGKVAADMTLSYWRQGGLRVAVTASDLAAVNSAWSAGGVKEVNSANMPGVYRIDFPDAAFIAGADWVVIAVKVAGCFVFYERFGLGTDPSQGSIVSSYASGQDPATLVLDVAAAGHNTAGTIGAKINLISTGPSGGFPTNFSSLQISTAGVVTSSDLGRLNW